MKAPDKVRFEYVSKGTAPPVIHVFINGVEVANVLNSTITTTRDKRTTVTLEFEAQVVVTLVEA